MREPPHRRYDHHAMHQFLCEAARLRVSSCRYAARGRAWEGARVSVLMPVGP